MDLTFQTEYNEDRSARVIARAWAVRTRGATILSWGMGIAGLIWLFGHVMDVNPEGDLFWCFFLLFYSLFAGLWRRLVVRWYRKAWRTQMRDAKIVNLHLTDDFYECSFGVSLSKTPWRTLATSYLFMDDAAVLFLHKVPCLVFDEADLRAGNVDRAEFEAVLRNAGLKSIYELRTRKVGIFLAWLFGLLIILCAVPRVSSAVSTRVLDIRTIQVRARLFREVHGATTNCPYVVETSLPSRLVSSFLKTAEPDECLYIFDDEEEEDKVGIFARYGERSYEAYFPCGCACEHLPGYFDHIKELHKSTVFFESEKEKWLEKVRPIAEDLYVPDDEEDGETCEENVLTSAVDAKTVEERTAAVVKAMKQLQVKKFEARTGEEIAQVVARLHELAKPGLPGLPSERSGISILLKSRRQEREQAEVLRKGFRVEDVSFYDVVGAFCATADYEFKVDGGYLRIAPTGTGFPDIRDRYEPTGEELCGHSPITDEERKLLHRMQKMQLPQISFRPPTALKDAVDFLIMASHPVGEPEAKIEIVIQPAQSGTASPVLPEISALDISFYEAAQLVSACVGYKMEIRGNKIYFREITGCELSSEVRFHTTVHRESI